MKRIFFIALLIFPGLFSCQKNELKIDPEHPLIGLWNLSEYQDNMVVYSRQNEFKDNPGINFHADGTLTVRQNSGWCGTPPVSYANYEGSWSTLNDTLLQVSAGYWGGTLNYRVDVESVTADSLKVIMIYENK
jgi:hypothetical protein